jgi:hypothetical protein
MCAIKDAELQSVGLLKTTICGTLQLSSVSQFYDMGLANSALVDRIFESDDLSKPWQGRTRFLISIDIGATRSAVVVALLKRSRVPTFPSRSKAV